MKKLLIIAIILSILLVGCAKKAPMYPVEQQKIIEEKQQEMPKIREIAPEQVAPTPEQPTLGNRLEEPVKEVNITPTTEPDVILLYPNKTISSGNRTLAVGDTLVWQNIDTWPHHLVVFTGTDIYTSKKHGEARLEAGETWNYTFNEPGDFLIKDMYSGGIRMYAFVK